MFTRTEVNRIVRRERRRASLLIFLAGIVGVLAGRCSGPHMYGQQAKQESRVSTTDTLSKTIITNNKQR